MKRQRGFTLVELLTVVAILGLTMAMAAMALRPNRAERLRSFVRSLIGSCHEARQSATSLRQTSRLKLTTQTTGYVSTLKLETRSPTVSTTWLPLGTIQLPNDIQLCKPEAAPNLTTVTPTCPIDANKNICIAPSGAVTVVDGTADCSDSAAGTGATIYVRTIDGKSKYKVVLFALTALPKVMDQW